MTIETFLLCLYVMLWSCVISAADKLPTLHHRSNLMMPENRPIPASLLFELSDNKRQKIVCETCHGIKDIQDKDYDDIDKSQDSFLRDGPYEKLSDFCYLCHSRKQNARENIHVLLDSDLEKKHQKKEKQCLYCHTDVLEQDTLEVLADQKINYKLRLPIEKICYGCHLRTPHLNAVEHQVKIEDKMLLYLQKSSNLYNVNFPLGENNQLLCVTCHDPHQQGVLQKKDREEALSVSADLQKGVSYKEHLWTDVYANDKRERLQQLNMGIMPDIKLPVKLNPESMTNLHYQRINNEVLLRLPAKNGMLCTACHDFSRERLW